MNKTSFSSAKLLVVFLVATIFLMTGCAQTQKMSADSQLELKSHFLGPDIVSKLKEGEDDNWGLAYMNPDVNWPSYNKVMVDPVQIWKDEGTKDVEPEDLARLANDLWSKIREEMGKDYAIVESKGPHVLHFQAAITEAEASDPTMDAVTSIIPQTRILTGLKGMAAGGKPGFVGAASIEMKITDGETGKLLAAGIDRRAGTKNPSGSTNEWNDVEENYRYWAERLRYRACQLREGKDDHTKCEAIEPEE